ncbi:MAG: hypothetical protein K0R54_319 [Clostridiaceae bacterium]|jgi:hypothetical protein|nr:hypothetical protein [Clostridiaceae bacterium]
MKYNNYLLGILIFILIIAVGYLFIQLIPIIAVLVAAYLLYKFIKVRIVNLKIKRNENSNDNIEILNNKPGFDDESKSKIKNVIDVDYKDVQKK